MLVNAILIRARRRQPLYAAFCDQSKAYDKVWRAGLWKRLHERGVKGPVLRFFRNLYRRSKTSVVCPQGKSRAFKDGTGVRHGGLESPDLFDIFMDDLLVHLETTGIGITIGNVTVPGLMFADDLVMLADSAEDCSGCWISRPILRKWRYKYITTRPRRRL